MLRGEVTSNTDIRKPANAGRTAHVKCDGQRPLPPAPNLKSCGLAGFLARQLTEGAAQLATVMAQRVGAPRPR